MKWYKQLSKQQKLNIREVFELTCGMSLNIALMLFSFSECMDLLHQKLQMEGIL